MQSSLEMQQLTALIWGPKLNTAPQCNVIKTAHKAKRTLRCLRREMERVPNKLVCRRREISQSCKQTNPHSECLRVRVRKLPSGPVCACLCVCDNWRTITVPVMCPGKRSFWTSLAVSPFQGQSRGPRWLSPFDFGKTSSPLLGKLYR